MLSTLPFIQNRKTGRSSSWDVSGRNYDRWIIPPGETAVLETFKERRRSPTSG
jgi:hypothetical protein